MSLTTPAVTTLAGNLVAALETALSDTIPLLPKAFTRVLSKGLSASQVLTYKYANFMHNQQYVSRATIKDTVINGVVTSPLTEWGILCGVGRRDAAVRAELTATITVLTTGGTLAANQQLVRAETGVIYLTTAAVSLDASSKTISIRASSDQDGNGGAGAIGNLENGDVITFAKAPPDVATEAVIASTVVTGADAQDVDDYRLEIVNRFRAIPQGGAYADYRLWAEAVAGMVAAYPYTSDTPGEVDVYVEATVASSGSADGIPTTAQLTEVADAIEYDTSGLAARRPANAAVNVYAISRSAFDVTVTGLTADDTATAEDAIEEALDDWLRSREPYIVGISVLPRKDRITEAALGGVIDEAASALGASVTTVSVSKSAAPVSAYELGHGEKAKLGTLTFS